MIVLSNAREKLTRLTSEGGITAFCRGYLGYRFASTKGGGTDDRRLDQSRYVGFRRHVGLHGNCPLAPGGDAFNRFLCARPVDGRSPPPPHPPSPTAAQCFVRFPFPLLSQSQLGF
jgi:hypothetical protein